MSRLMPPPSGSRWAAFIAAFFLSAANAHAAELTARGPAGCADAEEIGFRVERSIGMPLRAAEPLRFEVVMEQVPRGHRARIDVRVNGSNQARMQRVLQASDCEKLASAVSVFGLRVSPEVPRFVSLGDNPRLTDLFALAPLETTRFLFIERCGVQHLDALRGLAHAERIGIRENPELVETFGIADASFGELEVERNPRLVGVPSFVNGRSNSRIRVVGNSALESLSFAFTTAFGTVSFEGRELFHRQRLVRDQRQPAAAAGRHREFAHRHHLGPALRGASQRRPAPG